MKRGHGYSWGTHASPRWGCFKLRWALETPRQSATTPECAHAKSVIPLFLLSSQIPSQSGLRLPPSCWPCFPPHWEHQNHPAGTSTGFHSPTPLCAYQHPDHGLRLATPDGFSTLHSQQISPLHLRSQRLPPTQGEPSCKSPFTFHPFHPFHSPLPHSH